MANQPNSIALPNDAIDVTGIPADALSGNSVAGKAQATLQKIKSGGDLPYGKEPGPGRRFLQGAGIPTSLDELKQAAMSGGPGGAIGPDLQQGHYGQALSDFLRATTPILPSIADTYTNAASGNTAGAFGSAANTVLQAAPIAKGIAAGPMKSGAPTAIPPKIEQTIPIKVGSEPGPMSRVGRAAYEMLPIPKPIKAAKALMGGAPSDGRTVQVPMTVHPDAPAPTTPPLPPGLDPGPGRGLQPSTGIPQIPQPQGSGPINSPGVVADAMSVGAAKPQVAAPISGPPSGGFGEPTLGAPLPQPSGSAPVNSPGVVNGVLAQQSIPDMYGGSAPQGQGAQFGNAPRQPLPMQGNATPSAATKMSGDPARLDARFQPADQSLTSPELPELPGTHFSPRQMDFMSNQLAQHSLNEKLLDARVDNLISGAEPFPSDPTDITRMILELGTRRMRRLTEATAPETAAHYQKFLEEKASGKGK